MGAENLTWFYVFSQCGRGRIAHSPGLLGSLGGCPLPWVCDAWGEAAHRAARSCFSLASFALGAVLSAVVNGLFPAPA